MTALSIIIPCFNEEKNISPLISRIQKSLTHFENKYEIILVDDGSCDFTHEEMIKLSQLNKNIKIIKNKQNVGISKSWSNAFNISSGDYILTTDADFQYAPEDIILLLNKMLTNKYDIVQGIRAKFIKCSFLRVFLSKSFNILLNIYFKMNFKDIKSGFVIYKKNAFKEILKFNTNFMFFQHYIIIIAFYLNYKIFEIPVNFYSRNAGTSYIFHPFIFSLKALFELPKAQKLLKKIEIAR